MPNSSTSHPPRLSRPDALHTGWGKTHEGGMAYYNLSWGDHHLFADLELLDNVRELCRPAVFRCSQAAPLLATHIGDWRLRRQGLPDIVVRDVYWSRRAVFNVLGYPALRVKDAGTWWDLNSDEGFSWLEHRPSGLTIGLCLPGTPPEHRVFRLHHRHLHFNRPQPDWDLVETHSLFTIMDLPAPHVFSMEVYEAQRATRKGKSPRKPAPSVTSNPSERKTRKPSGSPPHANGTHPPGPTDNVPVKDYRRLSVARKPKPAKPKNSTPGTFDNYEYKGASPDETRNGYSQPPTTPGSKGMGAQNGRPTTPKASEEERLARASEVALDTKRPVIDLSAYPHVIDRILDYASAPLLARLRGVSQDFRRRADTRLLAHVKLDLDKLSLTARLGPGRGCGPRFANPVCFDPAGGITWSRLFEYDVVSSEDSSEVETDSEGYPTDYWDSDCDYRRPRTRSPMYEDRRQAPRRVEDFMRRLELSDKALLGKVHTLDLCATHLDRPTMLSIFNLFPNVHTLRTMGKYTIDTSDDYVLIKTTATTLVVFTSPWGVHADIDLPPIPKNVKHAVYHVTCHPTDADALLQPEGFNNPSALKAMTMIFTLSGSARQMSAPREKVWIHPAFEQYARDHPPPPREEEVEGMFLHMFGAILEGVPRIKFTLVGLLDLPPKFLCLPDSMDTPEKRRAGMLSVFRKRAQNFSFVVRGYASMREWLDDIPRRVVFMSREEYRASIPDEQFRLETMV